MKQILKQQIKTERINKTRYILEKEDNGMVSITYDHRPWIPQWSNGTDITLSLRLTRTKAVIEMDYFSDASSQQRTNHNKIYVKRDLLEETYNSLLNFTEDLDDEAVNYDILEKLYNEINTIYDRNTPYF